MNLEEEEMHIEEDNLNTLKDHFSLQSPRHIGAAGKSRYLKPSELEESIKNPYDFVIIANRTVKIPQKCSIKNIFSSIFHSNSFYDSFSNIRRDKTNNNSSPSSSDTEDQDQVDNDRLRDNHTINIEKNRRFKRFCMVNSPLLQESEEEYRRIVEKLCGEGLHVDIIDGGHSKNEITSDFFILLIRASPEVIISFSKKLKKNIWLEQGNVNDFEIDYLQQKNINNTNYNYTITPAERIEIVYYIIEKRAKLTKNDPWIHDLFPIHDPTITSTIINKYNNIRSIFSLDKKLKENFVLLLRYNFGEKVAYYFSFIDYYNTALIPIALLGLLLQVLKTFYLDTIIYMRILPFWSLFVSVLWSFYFLRKWDQKNLSTQFKWNNKLNVKQIEYYNNKYDKGIKTVNQETGEISYYYPEYKRYPKYFVTFLFMLLQTIIMLMLVALWVSIYELLKVKYPNGSFLSIQWFLILSEGIIFGLFVDILQWKLIVTKMAKKLTNWENLKTEDQFESSLTRKLFLMDFLNYYTWFFSLAFLYVIPGLGDYITNFFNYFFFNDKINCCFGPYVSLDGSGKCLYCPNSPNNVGNNIDCIECVGWFTFDIRHVDLSAMFVTPIIITQTFNILIELITPIIIKKQRDSVRKKEDKKAHDRIIQNGSLKIIGSLTYNTDTTNNISNCSNSRYLEYSLEQIEVLNKKAREILFESEQDSYDVYGDYHFLTVQFGFTVMFSVLWPLMPLACYIINIIKLKADTYRLCKTLKRPFPKKTNGIGEWKNIFWAFALIAVIVNIALICISTGSIEFFISDCIRDIKHQLKKQNKTLSDFILGPDFNCLNITWRLVVVLVLEHLFMVIGYILVKNIPKLNKRLKSLTETREKKLKKMLQENAEKLPISTDGNETLLQSYPDIILQLKENNDISLMKNKDNKTVTTDIKNDNHSNNMDSLERTDTKKYLANKWAMGD